MSIKITEEEEQRYAQLQLIALNFARDGNTQELKKMLDYGMNVNLCTHNNDTLLMLSSYKGYLELTKMLLEYGADVNRVNSRGQSPLEGVCFKGDLEMLKLLIHHGAEYKGRAMMYASIFGNKDIVQYLQSLDASSTSSKFLGIRFEYIAALTSGVRSLFFKKRPI